jgi:hypothetical protein
VMSMTSPSRMRSGGQLTSVADRRSDRAWRQHRSTPATCSRWARDSHENASTSSR